ncbi:MAG: DUF2071 domain-containing protein [Leptospiraceae bacterium]|nr:DUF2071 domain-containing protein [Leptospiraceae bacterium]
MSLNYQKILEQRIEARIEHPSILDVRTNLIHFALINYALPKERLERLIPTDRFEIPEFEIRGKKLALMSAVPFIDVDFHFLKIPFLKFKFPQTNYRVYVIDKKTGEHSVWFFGTTLGSYYVYIPRYGFNIPWHYAKYDFDIEWNSKLNKYERYSLSTKSNWGESKIELEDTGELIEEHEGFSSYSEMKLVLTHPTNGFFYRNDGQLGTYSIWHDEMKLTKAKPVHLYFGLYERLGLLSQNEMLQPVSIFLCNEILFDVYLPPKIET